MFIMPNSDAFIPWDTVEPVEMVPGLFRRSMGYTNDMLIIEVRAEAGVKLPLHSHPHEQVGYVVSGEMSLTIDGKTRVCKPGDSYAIPGDVEHSAVFAVASIIIDCFSPLREEYL